jgi:hypothetical protein
VKVVGVFTTNPIKLGLYFSHFSTICYKFYKIQHLHLDLEETVLRTMSYGPPWAHYLGGYQDRLLGGPLGLPGLRYTAPDGVEHKDYRGEVLG